MRRSPVLLVVLLGASDVAAARDVLGFDERVALQERIERLLDARRTSAGGPRQPFDARVDRQALEGIVERNLRQSAALEHWGASLTADHLQREMERMASSSRDPALLRALLHVLGDDPYLAAECLARPALASRRLEELYANDSRLHAAARTEAEIFRGTATPATFRETAGVRYRHAAPLPNGSPRLPPSPEAAPAELGPVVERRDGFIVAASHTAEEGGAELAYFPKEPLQQWLDDYELPPDWRAPAIDRARLRPVTVTGTGASRIHDTFPEPRTGHTSVWTGAEMIVWGGLAYRNTGWRYSPATDTWRPTAVDAGTPAWRSGHIATWTGAHMLVWGGGYFDAMLYEYSYPTQVHRYDPALDAWTVGAAGGGGRFSPSVVWTGSEMIVWGGYYYQDPLRPYYPPTYVFFASGFRYDPQANRWQSTSTAGAPTGRVRHAAVWTGSEMLVWGGDYASPCSTYAYCFSCRGDGGRYDPTSDTWRPMTAAGAPSPRGYASAAWTGSQMVLWGGREISCPTPLTCTATMFDTGARYDPLGDTFTPMSAGPATPSARAAATAVWTGADVIVWGGTDGTLLGTGARYAPATDTWSPTSVGPYVPSPRVGHTAVWTGGEMIVWGGSGTATGGRYDPSTDSWFPTATGADAPEGRRGHTAVFTGVEMIVWGGVVAPDPSAPWYDYRLASGARYQAWADAWQPTRYGTTTPTARDEHTAVWTGTHMVVWGGLDDGLATLDSGSRYDPVTDRWSPTSKGAWAPERRASHTAVWTGTEMIVWGGYPSSFTSGTGARYDPVADAWQPVALGPSTPDARRDHVAVWTGTEMIVWGGLAGGGGAYDPATDLWRTLSATADPGPRTATSAVWTGSEMIVWGGHDGSGTPLASGARYVSASDTWVPMVAPGAPTARGGHTAVWTGSDMIVWGGEMTDTGARYDPVADSWTGVSLVEAPSGRSGHAAVFTGVDMIVWGGEGPTTAMFPSNGGRYDPVRDAWSDGPPPQGACLLVAKGPGGGPLYGAGIRGYRVGGSIIPTSIDAFPTLVGHGANVAAGDADAGGAEEVLAAPGPGAASPPRIRGFDRTGAPVPGLDFTAYATGNYGASVGAGAIDAACEVLTGPGPSPVFGPHVRAFRYAAGTVAPIAKVSFYAYGTLRYGVRVTAGDLDGDAFDEIVTGAGSGAVFGPHVRAFDFDGAAVQPLAGTSFFAYGTLRYGVEVASGDVDVDGFDELLTGPGPSAAFAAQVRGFDVDGGAARPVAGINFVAFTSSRYGAAVAAGDLEGDGFAEIGCGAGPDPGFPSALAAFDYDGAAVSAIAPLAIDVFGLRYGLRVAAGDLGY